MRQKITVLGSFVVDLMARTPHLPAAGETVRGSRFKQGAGKALDNDRMLLSE